MAGIILEASKWKFALSLLHRSELNQSASIVCQSGRPSVWIDNISSIQLYEWVCVCVCQVYKYRMLIINPSRRRDKAIPPTVVLGRHFAYLPMHTSRLQADSSKTIRTTDQAIRLHNLVIALQLTLHSCMFVIWSARFPFTRFLPFSGLLAELSWQ